MTEEEIAKLTAIEKKQPVWQQLQALTDIADISQELLNVADSAKKESKAQIQALGAVLTDAREQLVELNKKEAPEAPDYAKPVVDAVAKLESVIKSLDLKPKITLPAPIVDLKSPDVNVSAPDVKIDLKPLEKLLKVDIPKAFKESIALIPTPEKDDNTAMLESLAEMNDWLKSIDTVARKKPMLGAGASSASGNGAILDGVDSAIKATVLDLTSSNPLTVGIVDGTGTQITSFGGGTQYADGAARGTATGTIAMGDDGTNIQSIKTDTSGVLAIQDNGGSITVDGTVTANAGSGTFTVAGAVTNTVLSVVGGGTEATAQRVTIANDSTGVLSVDDNGGSITVDAPVGTPAFVRLSDGAAAISTLPVSLATNTPTLQAGSTTTVTQGTGTNLHTVVDSGVITSITNAIPVTTTTTSTHSNVANSITSVTLLALNTSRKSATIYNDDTAASLYVKFGTTASATSFKIKIAPGGYYEFPLPIYTGRVDGIATAATGSARICEET